MIQNIDFGISGTCTKCLFFDSKQQVQNFWTSQTEFLDDTRLQIPEFLEFAQTGCNCQNTSSRITGLSTKIFNVIQSIDSRLSGTCTKCLLLTRNNRSRISGPDKQNLWLTENHVFQNFWNLLKLAVIVKTLVPE
jgi:hypothetical protein